MSKYLKIVIVLILALTVMCPQADAQKKKKSSAGETDPGQVVTLVITGVAPTKSEATAQALRSAIEQTYGTFVSSNTSILNDELVKDEVITISKGNIVKYNELNSMVLPDGNYSVTVQPTVSITRLTSYAESKGAVAELAGATIAMNMRLWELNKENEMTALSHLRDYVEAMIPKMYNKRSIYLGKIKEPGAWGFQGERDWNDIRVYDYNIRYRTYGNGEAWLESKKDLYSEEDLRNLHETFKTIPERCYLVPFHYVIMGDDATTAIFDTIQRTLQGISLSDQEAESYLAENNRRRLLSIYVDKSLNKISVLVTSSARYNIGYMLRNADAGTIDKIIRGVIPLLEQLRSSLCNFEIVDNLGVRSRINLNRELDFGQAQYPGYGIFSPFASTENAVKFPFRCRMSHVNSDYVAKDTLYSAYIDGIHYSKPTRYSNGYYGGELIINAYIPKDEIYKYSSFELKF